MNYRVEVRSNLLLNQPSVLTRVKLLLITSFVEKLILAAFLLRQLVFGLWSSQ